jgi:hypothetical protein
VKIAPKRTNFISIQLSSTVAAKGYTTIPLRTGYEVVVGQRVDKKYAFAAKEDGKVIKLTDNVLLVEYKSGKKDSVEIGTIYGKVTGVTVPHTLVTDYSLGNKFKAGDILAWNQGFFERDFFDKSQVSWKMGSMAKVALMEGADTFEDSCAISADLAEASEMPVSKERHILIDFNQDIHNLLSVGDEVNSDTILCTIEDAVTSDTGLFDEDTISSLSMLAANTPKAKIEGKVARIEVLYLGDKKDMSSSLKKIVDRSDRERANRAKDLDNRTAPSGAVREPLRVGGTMLERDQAIISVFIDGMHGAGVGDKAVFAHSLKTVVGRVMVGKNETEAGDKLDGLFGYHAISARVVNSPEITGTTNTLLRVLSKKTAEVYRKG